MCDVCERVLKELRETKKLLDELTTNRDRENPINIDLVKTTKAMCYEKVRYIYKKAKNNP